MHELEYSLQPVTGISAQPEIMKDSMNSIIITHHGFLCLGDGGVCGLHPYNSGFCFVISIVY